MMKAQKKLWTQGLGELLWLSVFQACCQALTPEGYGVNIMLCCSVSDSSGRGEQEAV